jgi:hypothetical protein
MEPAALFESYVSKNFGRFALIMGLSFSCNSCNS